MRFPLEPDNRYPTVYTSREAVRWHVVEPGEHLAAIAASYGFFGFDAIWGHPDNAELKELRGSPHILFPGDRLFIPDRTTHEEELATSQVHRFRVKEAKMAVRIDVNDLVGEDMANRVCLLEIDHESVEVSTDGDGIIDHEVKVTFRGGLLTVGDLSFHIQVGHLDPITEPTGQMERLRNLGFVARSGANDYATLIDAIETFQSQHRLKVDGVCGSKTRQKLLEEHGC